MRQTAVVITRHQNNQQFAAEVPGDDVAGVVREALAHMEWRLSLQTVEGTLIRDFVVSYPWGSVQTLLPSEVRLACAVRDAARRLRG